MFERRSLVSAGYCVVAILGAWAIAFAPSLVFGRTLHGAAAIYTITGSTALAIAWALPWVVLVWRRADEFQREGSRFAWLWGATIGLALSEPIFMFIALGGMRLLDPNAPLGRDLRDAFTLGYLLAIGSQLIGFAVAFAAWRLSKR